MSHDLADLVPPAGLAVARVHALAVHAGLLLGAALVAGATGNWNWQNTGVKMGRYSGKRLQ